RRGDAGRDAPATRSAAPVPDLGPGGGAGELPRYPARSADAGLSRRSALALAARLEREHQPPPASLVHQGQRPVHLEPRRPTPHRPSPQQPTQTHPRPRHPRPTTRPTPRQPPPSCTNHLTLPHWKPRLEAFANGGYW